MAETPIDNFRRQNAAGSASPTRPYPPFPKVPDEIKKKFSDLTPFFEEWEKSIALWVKNIQAT